MKTTRLPVPKSVSFPKAKTPKVKAPPILSAEQSLKKFATTPVVNPLGKVATREITKPLKSYLPK